MISDALNHASVIDGVRLYKAKRFRYANNDMADLERCLKEVAGARHRVIATDGVFSMDGVIADLPAICDLAERYDALVMVDDSHAVGCVGAGGRGTPELCGVADRVDILTGTLGKALGGASGGYTSGRREIVEMLRQRSRPYLFSNTLAPVIAAASLTAFDLVENGAELRQRLDANAASFRRGWRRSVSRWRARPPDHPGDARRRAAGAGVRRPAARTRGLRHRLLVSGGAARPGAHPHQMSAAHSPEDVAVAIEDFAAVEARAGSDRMKNEMLALVKAQPEPGLWMQAVPVPEPGPNDVLIKVTKSAICGTDVHIWNWDAWAAATVPVPMVVGHEFVGRIADTGAAVTPVQARRAGVGGGTYRLRLLPRQRGQGAGISMLPSAWGRTSREFR